MARTVGVLHPGAMGASVGAAARAGGARVLWCAAARSQATRARAEKDGLEATESLRELLDASDVVLSVCPPVAARDVARSVALLGFDAWEHFGPDLKARVESTARGVGPKAWRFTDEMREIAASFGAAGLPSEFHQGAAEIYARLERFKDGEVSLADVLEALLER